jgi:hypothetical protein
MEGIERGSSKFVLDFDTSWALQSYPDQGTYLEYTRELFPLFNIQQRRFCKRPVMSDNFILNASPIIRAT